jgi:hypothetical protein
MKASELKSIVKECVREILQEDDLISNIIIQSFKASETIRESSIRSNNKIDIIQTESQKKNVPEKPKNTNMKDVWKKVLEVKKPSREQLDEHGYGLDTIDVKQSNHTHQKQELTFMDLLKEDKHEEKVEIQEDKEFMNFFAKKFKK